MHACRRQRSAADLSPYVCRAATTSAGFLESNVQRGFRSSLTQHLLVSYCVSFAAILRGQHTGKSIKCAVLNLPIIKCWTPAGGFAAGCLQLF